MTPSLGAEERERDVSNKALALKLWETGYVGSDIAERCGYASSKTVYQLIRRCRKRDGSVPRRVRGKNRLGARCWKYLRCIDLRLRYQLTETQIAERLSISVFGVRNHIARARKRGEFTIVARAPQERRTVNPSPTPCQ